jgi:hypothetical protein
MSGFGGDGIRLRGLSGKKLEEQQKKDLEDFKKQLDDPLLIEKLIKERDKKAKGSTARIPRKPGQPAGSKKHSDLYTDENPKGTIQGLKFKTESDAKKSVAKIRKSGKTRAHKIQAAVAMEQRAGVMGKASSAGVYRKFIDSAKRSRKAKGGLIRGIPKIALRGY